MSVVVTHFTTKEGGDFFPADQFRPGVTRFNVLRFADGSVWDAACFRASGDGWRGDRLYPVESTEGNGTMWTHTAPPGLNPA